ncbi:hypothetical protein RCH08_004310 [Janthinobacterium sp. CG_S6]|nr:hypothetical protein [Janthinobacterium sp. CG_S6]
MAATKLSLNVEPMLQQICNGPASLAASKRVQDCLAAG